MRAAIYTRVSSEEQARGGVSLDVQRQDCERAAREAGATSVELFSDPGCSGSKITGRPALQDLLARKAEFDCVFVWRLDRLSRKNRDNANIMADLADAQVRLVSIKEGFDLDSVAGRLMANMLASVAQAEWESIRERVMAGQEERARLGRHTGKPALGYRYGKTRPRLLEPNPETAPFIRELFRRYAEGESLNELTRWVCGPPMMFGHKWTYSAVRKVLCNPVYIGEITRRGQPQPGIHEPLISLNLWQKVQRRLRDNQGIVPATRNHTLTPVFKCGLCGGSMGIGRDGRDKPSMWRYFLCLRRRSMAKEQRHDYNPCGEEKAERLVWAVVEWLLDEDLIGRAHREHLAEQARKQSEGRLAELATLRDDLNHRLLRNAEAYQADAVTLEQLRDLNLPLQAEIERVTAELNAALESDAVFLELQAVTTEAAVALAKRASIEDRRRFLLTLFERVEVHVGKLRFILAVPGMPALEVDIPRNVVELREPNMYKITPRVLTPSSCACR